MWGDLQFGAYGPFRPSGIACYRKKKVYIKYRENYVFIIKAPGQGTSKEANLLWGSCIRPSPATMIAFNCIKGPEP